MASNSEEHNVQGRQSSKKLNQKKCDSCEAYNPNASKQCKGCGAQIKIRAFDWAKLKTKKKTNPTNQRKMLQYRANVLNLQHGWHVVVLCMANHKRGRSLYTYGTPGVGLKFVGDKKEKASKAGRLCASMFKKFVKKHDVGSDSVSQGDQDMNSASGGNSVQPMEIDDNNTMEYDATIENDPSIDDFQFADVYGRVGLDGEETTDGQAVVEAGVADGGRGRAVVGGGVADGGRGRAVVGGGVADGGRGRAVVRGGLADGGRGRAVVGGGVAGAGGAVSVNGVAYVVDNDIKAVGKVDHSRKILHGHEITSGFVCVELSYVKTEDIVAPLILGDKEENSFLRKGMFFVFPISKLFTLGKHIAGDKVVLQSYVP